MRIAILHSEVLAGANLDEQETLEQANAIKNALKARYGEVALLPFDINFVNIQNRLQDNCIDLVVNLVESINGRSDYTFLAALFLEQANIPFTGASANNIFNTNNKLLAKSYLRSAGLPTPDWLIPSEACTITKPYIIKSVNEHGSFALTQDSISDTSVTLYKIFKQRVSQYGGCWFAEEYIAGREINVGFICDEQQLQIFPIAEIEFVTSNHLIPIVDYAAKWQKDSEQYSNFQRIFINDNGLHGQITKLVCQVKDLFQLVGYYRMDVRIDHHDRLWILEINANPSLAEDAGFAAQANKAGYSYTQMINWLIDHPRSSQRAGLPCNTRYRKNAS